jgi:hypothetical protein
VHVGRRNQALQLRRSAPVAIENDRAGRIVAKVTCARAYPTPYPTAVDILGMGNLLNSTPPLQVENSTLPSFPRGGGGSCLEFSQENWSLYMFIQ